MRSNDHNPLLSPEDRLALQALPRRAMGAAVRQVKELRGMRPWMRAYAAWLAEQPVWPKNYMRISRASMYAAERLQPRTLKFLEDRRDFKELLAKLEDDAVARARHKLEVDLPYYIEKHKEGLELAAKEQDYRAYKDFTVPALDRVWPKHHESAAAGNNVTIILSERQAADLSAIPLVVEAEVVESEPESPAGE